MCFLVFLFDTRRTRKVTKASLLSGRKFKNTAVQFVPLQLPQLPPFQPRLLCTTNAIFLESHGGSALIWTPTTGGSSQRPPQATKADFVMAVKRWTDKSTNEVGGSFVHRVTNMLSADGQKAPQCPLEHREVIFQNAQNLLPGLLVVVRSDPSYQHHQVLVARSHCLFQSSDACDVILGLMLNMLFEDLPFLDNRIIRKHEL